jgi:hypothetical protein
VLITGLSAYLYLRDTDRTRYQLPVLPDLAGRDISRIEINRGGGETVLEKKGDHWQILPQGYPADAEKVQAMLKVIKTLTLTALVAESKAYERYDLSSDKRISVKAWSGRELLRDFDVGKAAGTFQHTFIKLAGNDRVYHARENFRQQFDQSGGDLRDKTVLRFAARDIQAVTVTQAATTTVFRRKAAKAPEKSGETPSAGTPAAEHGEWESDAGTVDGAALEALLDVLDDLACEKYIEGKDPADFSQPIYTLQLKGPETYSLAIFAPLDADGKNYPALSSGSEYVFLLPEWRIKTIMKSPENLLAGAAKP